MSAKLDIYREGTKLKDEKNYEGAIEKFIKVREIDPTDIFSMHAQVQCLTELGRHPEAIDLAKKIVELDANDYFSYIALSRALQRAGMIPEAEYAMMQGQQVQMRAAAAKK